MGISAYSATPGLNTSISGINIAEGCNASGINDAIRQLMADLAVPQFGSAVGIGMAPVNPLDITLSASSASLAQLKNANGGVNAQAGWSLSNGTSVASFRMFGTAYTTNNQERQSGAILQSAGNGGLTLYTVTDGIYMWVNTNRVFVSDGSSCQFVSGGSGGVQLLNSATAWSAISDYRSKNVYAPFTDAGAIIDAVPVHLAQYKNGKQPMRPMFLAHEVAEGGAAFAVDGKKDAINEDGTEKMQSIQSTDPLVPILWAAVRELRAEVAALKAAA